jgi:hypothetical protein
VFRSAVASRVVHLYEKSIDELRSQCTPPAFSSDEEVLKEIGEIDDLFAELERNGELEVSAISNANDIGSEVEMVRSLPLPSVDPNVITPSPSADELFLMELERNSELEVAGSHSETEDDIVMVSNSDASANDAALIPIHHITPNIIRWKRDEAPPSANQ